MLPTLGQLRDLLDLESGDHFRYLVVIARQAVVSLTL